MVPMLRLILPPDGQLEEWSNLLDGDLHFAEQMELLDTVLGVSFKSGDTMQLWRFTRANYSAG